MRVLVPAIPFLKFSGAMDKSLGELINLFQRLSFLLVQVCNGFFRLNCDVGGVFLLFFCLRLYALEQRSVLQGRFFPCLPQFFAGFSPTHFSSGQFAMSVLQFVPENCG